MYRILSLSALALALVLTPNAALAEKKAEKNIVETAVAADDFETLVAAVKAAGLAETLQGPGPFTVFAPTDKAFAKLGKEKIAALLKDKEKLAEILKYHVVSGNVMSGDAVKLAGKSARTVQGQPIALSMKGDSVCLNGTAKVIKADIKCSNGVIHVIDTVLLPPTK